MLTDQRRFTSALNSGEATTSAALRPCRAVASGAGARFTDGAAYGGAVLHGSSWRDGPL